MSLTKPWIIGAALLLSGAVVLIAADFTATLLTTRQSKSVNLKSVDFKSGDLNSGDLNSGDRATAIIEEVGCGSCHYIPGVAGARGLVGPPLNAFSERGYIAGILPNDMDNLTVWLWKPQTVDPQSAMPATGLSEQEAGLIAEYLLNL
jgi:mono/diheme cytochrome c family protein